VSDCLPGSIWTRPAVLDRSRSWVSPWLPPGATRVTVDGYEFYRLGSEATEVMDVLGSMSAAPAGVYDIVATGAPAPPADVLQGSTDVVEVRTREQVAEFAPPRSAGDTRRRRTRRSTPHGKGSSRGPSSPVAEESPPGRAASPSWDPSRGSGAQQSCRPPGVAASTAHWSRHVYALPLHGKPPLRSCTPDPPRRRYCSGWGSWSSARGARFASSSTPN